MHKLSHFLPLPIKKGQEYHEEEWVTRVNFFTKEKIIMTNMDGLPTLMRDEIDD